ncbi:hypothetical protein B0E46_08525 [Rhodanobacter sp. B04]|uniref:hypothetical protein n=1 Tax=Rhodanobacter sp. B04 TaxID=1945860 RepID=UPI0009872F1A|nr:hypothetical protein [Rhodanobacter sp. B04]OOG63966.1 hypothetical protein B0E46_08525 [Rhodanobacter sp. B04]
MIELEIQALSESREGLLIEVGGFVIANGFTLQRQRLVQDPHGILMTMVVRGPWLKKRALVSALNAYDRFLSLKVEPYVEGESRPHFAASRKPSPYTAPPAPMLEPAPAAAAVAPKLVDQPEPVVAPAIVDVPEAQQLPPERESEPEFEFILPNPPRPAAAPAPAAAAPFVELIPQGPDEPAVDKLLRGLEYDYPRIVPQLLALDRTVAEAARESSLALAGQRIGGWVFEREYALDGGLDLHDAIERIGVPALRALAEVDLQGAQLHIQDSALCAEHGHSGCSFFSGFLEGLLGAAIAPGSLSIFPVCCRSYGADECVLAISD